MSQFSHFGAAYTDVLKQLRHVVTDYDSDEGMADGQTIIEGYMDRAELYIYSRLPKEIATKLTKIEGEIIVRSATDGQSTATLGITTSTSNLKLYKNPMCRLRDLTEADQMATTEYSESGGAVTFSPALGRTDLVVASYDHGKTSFALLKHMLIDLVAFRCSLHQSEERQYAEVEALYQEHAKEVLGGLSGEGAPGFVLQELADLEFYEGDVFRKEKAGVTTGKIELS